MRNDQTHLDAGPFLPRFLGMPLSLFLLCLALLHPGQAFAAAVTSVKEGNTRIVSEKLTYDANRNLVIFEGNVHVTRPNLEIWSDTLTVVLDDSGKKNASSGSNALKTGGGKVDRIIAEKNVRIQQGNKSGTSGKATYFVTVGKIVMEQNPVIVDGDNRIKGRIINYFTESGRSEVIGDVDVQFTTDDNKTPALPGLDVGKPVPAEPTVGEKALQ